MKKICVYTCITGDYDNLNEIENVEKNIDYYCFTNNKEIKSNTWKVIYINDNELNNHLLSRKIKMLGHEIINKKYDISVWMDADIIIKKSITDFVKKYLNNKSFAAFKHQERNCIYEEAKACLKLRKDTKENILKTVDFLKSKKYPENNGLYEMTIFIKKHNDPKVIETMNMWFDMVCNYSKRDQLSFMYCIWKTGLDVSKIDLSVWNNEWFSFKKHNNNKKLTSYRIYYGNEKNFDYDMNIESEYNIKNNYYSFKETVLKDVEEIKIEITNTSYFRYSDLVFNKSIKDKISNIEYKNSIEYLKDYYFLENGIIILHGFFKKGDVIDFKVKLVEANEKTIQEIQNYCSSLYLVYKSAFESEVANRKYYEKKFNDIINSSSWKITKPIRKFKSIISKTFKNNTNKNNK